MAVPNQTYKARVVRLFSLRQSLCILFALLLQTAQVAGQGECTTFPCSISIAVYGTAPPLPESSTPNPPQPPPLPTTSTSASSSSSSSSSAYSSSAIIPQTSSPTLLSPSTTPSVSSSSSSTVLSASSTIPVPSSFNTDSSSTSIVTSSPNNVTPSSISTPSVSPSGIQTTQSPSGSTSSPSSTQIRLPSFSTTSSISPSITPGPNFNSSTTNGTSSTQCGQCSVMADQVQVYYWPTASVRSNCARASAAASYQSAPYYAANATTNATQSLTALASAGSTDVVNGFTFTFPSTYVSVVGKIHVSNSCGVFGKTYTNPTPVAVRAITTASYASWPSECRPQGNYVDAVIDTLDIADIACPTWGLSNPFYTTCDGETYLTATEGPPYNPVILVPTEFLGYDPAWGQCTKIPSNGPFLLPCGLYDPPRALSPGGSLGAVQTPVVSVGSSPHTPAPALVPSPDVVQPTPSPQQPSPQQQQPQQQPPPQQQSAQQQQTQQQPPQQQSPQQQPPQQQSPQQQPPTAVIPGPPNPSPSNNDPGQPSPGAGSPSSQDPSNPASGGPGQSNLDPNNHGSGSTNASPNSPGSTHGTDSSGSVGGSNNPAANPQAPIPQSVPVPQTTINIGGQPSSAQPTGGIGSVVNGAFGASPPQGNPQSDGGQGSNGGTGPGTNPGGSSGSNSGGGNSGGGSSGTPGGSGGGSSGTSGGSSGGGSGAGSVGTPNNNQGNTPANPAIFTPHAITALGATLSALNPTAVAVGGKTLSAGGPAFTSNGNFYSLGPSGNLIAGTLGPAVTPAPAALTFGGKTYTANSAGQFVIGGQTLAPGQAITVSGTPISEAPGGGVAVVGGTTQSLIIPVPSQGPALLTFGGATYTANAASQFVVGSQTLTPGGQITVSGTVLSEGASGGGASVVIGGSSTQSLAHGAGGGAAVMTSAAVMTFGGQTYTANAAGNFVVNGQTLTPGGVITVSGTPISEGVGASDVVIGTSTEFLSTAAVTQSAMTFEGGGGKVNAPEYVWLFALMGSLMGAGTLL